MKKIVSIFLSSCVFFSLIGTAYSDSPGEPQVSAQVDQIAYLINVGMPQSYLERRTPHEIDSLFALAQAHTLQHFSVSVPYFEDAPSAFGTIPAADMMFNIDGVAAIEPPLPNRPSRLTSVLVTIDYRWSSGHPLVRAEDAIAVNWDSSLFQFVNGTFNSTDYHLMGSTNAPVNAQTRPAIIEQGGLGYYASLFNTSPNPIVYSGNASFMVEAKRNIYAEEDYPYNKERTLIGATYTHNESPLGIGLSFSINGGGISVSPGSLRSEAGDACSIIYSMP